MSALPSVRDDGAGAIRFAIRVTLADTIAFERCFRRSADLRRLLGYALVGATLVAGSLAFLSMLAARAALAGSDCDLDASFDADGRLRMFLVAAAAILAFEIVGALLVAWTWLGGTDAVRRERRSKRVGVDPADPDLAEPFLCAFNHAGFRFEAPSLDLGAIWSAARRVEETADHMFLFLSMNRAFVIPKRDVPAAAILAVRDLAHEAGKLKLA